MIDLNPKRIEGKTDNIYLLSLEDTDQEKHIRLAKSHIYILDTREK